MESGLPRFRPGFTCPDLLRYWSHLSFLFAYGALTLYRSPSQMIMISLLKFYDQSYNPKNKFLVWAIPTSLAATTGISIDFYSSAYLDVSIQQVLLSYPMYSDRNNGGLTPLGFPIRKSSVQCFFPAPRSLSQVSTSFIACRCQGIHQ